MKFQKPALSLPDLAQRWCDRGLEIPDPAETEHYLRFIGYYRLSAYALPLQDKTVPSAGDEMSLRHGPHWFMDAGHFKANAPRFKHHRLLDRVDQGLQIQNGAISPSKPHHEVFINHYYATYTHPYLPPAWMVAETLTLGTWSLIFENLRDTNERKQIALPLQTDEQVLRNWLHALTYLRNLCAHQSRLWNRQFVIKPMIAKRHARFLKSNDRCYAMAVVVEDLLRTVAPDTSWALRLRGLLDSHPFVDPAAMGFPTGWDAEPFWNLPTKP